MSKRGELLKAFMDRDFTYEMIMEYTERIRIVPEEKKEEQAAILIREIEEKYPLGE